LGRRQSHADEVSTFSKPGLPYSLLTPHTRTILDVPRSRRSATRANDAVTVDAVERAARPGG
jgi:hypothetical protein